MSRLISCKAVIYGIPVKNPGGIGLKLKPEFIEFTDQNGKAHKILFKETIYFTDAHFKKQEGCDIGKHVPFPIKIFQTYNNNGQLDSIDIDLFTHKGNITVNSYTLKIE